MNEFAQFKKSEKKKSRSEKLSKFLNIGEPILKIISDIFFIRSKWFVNILYLTCIFFFFSYIMNMDNTMDNSETFILLSTIGFNIVKYIIITLSFLSLVLRRKIKSV